MPLNLTILGFGITQLGMLWWLAAAAAPLVIHLLNRRRYREVPWAAIEQLLAAMKRSARRVRFEQWLLLALRTAIIVAVVLAVAGPYVARVGGRFVAGEPVHRVLVLDGSYSMDFKPGDRTRFELAKDLARDLVARSAQGDGFTLVLMSAPARTVVGTPAFVSDEVRSALKQLHGSQGADLAAAEHVVAEDDFLKELREIRLPQAGGDLAGALDRVDEIVAQAKREYPRLATTEIYFLTDLGRTSWGPAAANAGGALHDRLVRLSRAARLSIADLGQENIENLAITGLHATQSVFTTRSPLEFQAEVRNFGARPHQTRAELWVDGRRMQEHAIEVAPQSNQTVVFAQRLETTGDHALEVRLVGDPLDLLEVDNHCWLAVPVKDTLSALIVNGEGALENTRYLYDALDPYRDGSGPLPVRVERVTDGSLLEQDLRRFDVVFLSNVAEFTAAEGRLLADYSRGGGGLVFFLGDHVNAARYNQELGSARPGAAPLLPALLDGPADLSHYGFDPLDYGDPLLREFRGNERAGLLSTTIARYFRLRLSKLSSPSASSPTASVKDVKNATSLPSVSPAAHIALAIRQTGDPAIVVSANPTGGRSIVVALPASFGSLDSATKEPWSNWPLKASFPPIVQNLLLAAIGPQGADRNSLVGRPLASTLPTSGTSGVLVLQTPDGRKEQIRVAARDESNRWSFANTWQSGIYRAQFPSAGDQERLFSVNLDTAESDLARIEPDQLPEGLTVVKALAGADDRPAADLEVRSGYERILLYTALALLLSESLLAWWFGYRAT